MSNRREFIKGSLVAAAALTVASPNFASAAGTPDGIVYTAENPGKYSKKVGSHLPQIEVSGRKVMVNTKHGMSAAHYIVRHTLVLENGEVLGAKNFKPDAQKAVSTYDLPTGYKGKIYATSFCTLHDLWMNTATV